MYCKIGLLECGKTIRSVLLPVEALGNDESNQWSAHLSHQQQLYVCSQYFSLAIGDWLQRQLQRWQHNKKLHPAIMDYQAAVRIHLALIGIHANLKWRKVTSQLMLKAQQQVCERQDEARQFSTRKQVLQWLQGRKLLYDEWLGLLKEQMHEGGDEWITNDSHNANGATICNADIQNALYWLLLNGKIQLRSAVEWSYQRRGRAELCCLRCYETKLVPANQHCPYCGEHCYYCSSCLQMGRARTCAALLIGGYHSPIYRQHEEQRTPEHLLDLESFSLSAAQLMATSHALSFVYQRLYKQEKQKRERTGSSLSRQFLLWAVTGAGKTEMIFPLIAYMAALGGRVLLATPRRDVVLELSPRLKKAFPELAIVTLYGGSTERWHFGDLVLATTHQLMRFQHAFDLVIIDELDAFPYHGDERLYRVAAQARAPHGITILLSATPPRYLQREINKGRLAHVKLPVRFHRHPLPVPIRLKVPLIAEQLRTSTIPQSLLIALKRSLGEDAQIFIFLQRIIHTEAYAKLLRKSFPHIPIEATSSQDEQRSEKVMLFRNREIRILVTTTILERGVTVPRSHVYICDAEAELFDESSLVQMAGRAGRSHEAPKGAVYFLSKQWSAAQKRAIKQINEMNRLALQQGYLLPQYQKGSGKER